MIFKTYQIYLSKVFSLTLLKTFIVFLSLAFILNIFEEVNFFKDLQVSITLPIFLTFLNIPSVIFDIFPFIFLITAQFAFIKLMDQNEITVLKNFGLDNFKIIKILSILSFFIGLTIITIYYNFSSSLKYSYLNLKNSYAKDNKYLAVITENGIWIKDEIDNEIIFTFSKKIEQDNLIDVEIIKLNKDFQYLSTITSKKINIRDNIWIAETAIKLNNDNSKENLKNFKLKSNFNFNKINNLYSDLSSVTIWGMMKLKKDYESVNYSTTEIDYQFQKILSYPIYLTIMSLLSVVFMLNFKAQTRKIFVITFGIFISVLIYYINHFFGIVGRTEAIPLSISIWIPLVILLIVSTVGLVRINEK